METVRIRDPGSWMEKCWILDKHPGSATLKYLNIIKYCCFSEISLNCLINSKDPEPKPDPDSGGRLIT